MNETKQSELRVDAYCSECNKEREYFAGTEKDCERCGKLLEVTGIKDEVR